MDIQIKDHVFLPSGGTKVIGFAIAEYTPREGACTKSNLAEVAKIISDAPGAETHCF